LSAAKLSYVFAGAHVTLGGEAQIHVVVSAPKPHRKSLLLCGGIGVVLNVAPSVKTAIVHVQKIPSTDLAPKEMFDKCPNRRHRRAWL
jgi:hypothetical protein